MVNLPLPNCSFILIALVLTKTLPIRAALSIPRSTDILEHVYSLPSSDQEPAMESIRAIERTAMAAQKPQPGLAALMEYLEKRGVRKGICTRNFDLPVTHLLSTFLPGHVFAPIITRDFRPPKPHPAGILHIARKWGLEDGGERLIMVVICFYSPYLWSNLLWETDANTISKVGDSIDDMTAGHHAGAATVLLVNEVNEHLKEHEHTDVCIGSLDDLISVLENGFEAGDECFEEGEARKGEEVEVGGV
ncbi:hypothetical protein MMC18_004119 [Xylographa bjoerkii]|nr:hypothetical protein [Xylographa bjoerkii]